MSYRDVYEKWLSSSALSEAEKEELRSISGDEKEIESRFFGPRWSSAPPACAAPCASACTR